MSSCKQGLMSAVVLVAPVVLAGKAVYAVRHRDDPASLSRLDGEGFAYGLAANAGLIAMMTTLLWAGTGQAAGVMPVLAMVVLCALNAVVAGTAVTVLAVSRVRERFHWSMIDYVDRSSARNRPPDTVEEHEAERLKPLVTPTP